MTRIFQVRLHCDVEEGYGNWHRHKTNSWELIHGHPLKDYAETTARAGCVSITVLGKLYWREIRMRN